MKGLNHKPLVLAKIKELVNDFQEYTLGEIFYAILRNVDKEKGSNLVVKELLTKTDREIFTAVDLAQKTEKE